MAANNGRGPSRPADFRYTDTIADKDAVQGILVKQDSIINRINTLEVIVAREAALEYNNAFAMTALGDFISGAVATGIEANIASGFIANPFSGESTLTANSTTTAIVVANIGNFTVADVVYIRSSARAQFRVITAINTSTSTITFGVALAAAAFANDTISVAVGVSTAGNPPADILPVDLKN